MGKYRKKTDNRFQNITLKGTTSEPLPTEFIAGFPPYVRGYRAMGYLQQTPNRYPVLFWEENMHFEKEKHPSSEILFRDLKAVTASEVENKSLIINNNIDFLQISEEFQQIKHIYLPIDTENDLSIGLLNPFSKEILQKIHFLLFFDAKVFQKIDLMRKVREFWSEIMQKNNFSFQIPITCYVNNINEQLYALSAQCDNIIYNSENEELNNSVNAFTIDNSGILKTIDPFWK